MLNNLLEGITVVDFTTRLPGPLGSMILKEFGAKVIKLESSLHGDQFNNPKVYESNPCFLDWYKNLNQDKSIYSVDFESEKSKLKTLVSNSDAILIPDHPKFINLLDEITQDTKVVIRLSGGIGEWKSLHDLNALGFTKTFSLHANTTNSTSFKFFHSYNSIYPN